MRSQKIRLKLTKEQDRLAWWYSKVSRNFWNLLVDIDKRNNKGEFDDILSKNGNRTYYSKFYNRNIYHLNESDYTNLAKFVIAKNSTLLSLLLLKTMRQTEKNGLGIISPIKPLSIILFQEN